MSSAITLLYCPFPTRDAAQHACLVLLKEQLIACGNILPGAESHYWWEGVLTKSDEYILLAKTTQALREQTMHRLSTLHPYACPAILCVDATANPAYAAWVLNTTRDYDLPKASD